MLASNATLEAPEPSWELEPWLLSLHLSQYASCFHHGGYRSLQDCADLTDERLRELKVLPTGHRRRILRALEVLGVIEKQGPRKSLLAEGPKKGGSCLHYRPKERQQAPLEGSRTLPARAQPEDSGLPPPALLDHRPAFSSSSSSSSSSTDSLPTSENPTHREIVPEDATFRPSPPDVPPPSEDEASSGCGMVDNAIYNAQPTGALARGPRLTRSYRLRHRPVPDIPQHDR